MKILTLLLSFVLLNLAAKAQDVKPAESKKDTTGVVALPKVEEDDYVRIFTKAEKEPVFPGGEEAWKRYIQRNLNSRVADDDGAPSGVYTVKVQFIVDKTGNLSNIMAIQVPKQCPSCGPEAVKVIKKGPRWVPAVQNGRNVVFQKVQEVHFEIVVVD